LATGGGLLKKKRGGEVSKILLGQDDLRRSPYTVQKKGREKAQRGGNKRKQKQDG